jgi:SH3-like domain-containing protein
LTALLALFLMLTVSGPAALAADQSQATPTDSAKPKSAKPTDKSKATKPAADKSKTAKKPPAQVPTIKAPAAKPAQPVPAPAALPAVKPPEKADAAKPNDAKTGPRFAALRAEKVYLRAGPGPNFPIQWVFLRRGLPVEILANFDIYRKIRDSEGTVGWVNQQLLTSRRTVLVAGEIRELHGDPNPTSEVIARLEPGVIASVSKCDPTWCEVKAGGYKGWLKRAEVWGLEPDEVIQ